jgi:hypothetical protein
MLHFCSTATITVTRIQVFFDVTPCHWVIKEFWTPWSVSFETSETINPATQRYIPEDLHPRQYLGPLTKITFTCDDSAGVSPCVNVLYSSIQQSACLCTACRTICTVMCKWFHKTKHFKHVSIKQRGLLPWQLGVNRKVASRNVTTELTNYYYYYYSLSPLCTLFIYLKQTMSPGNTVLQPFCTYSDTANVTFFVLLR